jgi:uncharacterized protein (AIM24 family)
MSITTYNPNTLPVNDNINPYSFAVDVNGQYFVQKGRMIAYYGNLKFEALNAGALSNLIAHHFSAPLYHNDFMVASGNGKLILGDRGFDINSYDLEDGNLTVRAGNLLGFDPSMELKQSIIPGFLVLIGTGKFLASSNGPVHFMEPPVRVDPQAVVGWADVPSPCHHYDHSYMQGVMGMARAFSGFGGSSGEEHQFDFTGKGTVLMQSSEAVVETPAMIAEIEGQIGILGVPGLQRVQARVQQQLAAQQQQGY